MKFKMLATLALSFSVLSSAQAAIIPGWDRPLQSAEMKVVEAVGTLEGVTEASLTQFRQDPIAAPGAAFERQQGFILTLTKHVASEGALISQAYRLVNVKTETSCGSKIFTAVAPGVTLKLQDNTTRLCRDLRPGTWEATLEISDMGLETSGKLRLVGNPEVVYTIQ